jgi:hypothetical protein
MITITMLGAISSVSKYHVRFGVAGVERKFWTVVVVVLSD